MIGRVVGQYRVDALLGESRDAGIYRATHRERGSTHALKIPWLRSERAREVLFEEGRLRARLSHRNLVGVTDVVTSEVPALVLEYVAGPSLHEWLSCRTPSLSMALGLFRGIVDGVAAAHAAGLAVTELSSSRILLAPCDDGFVPKLGLLDPIERAPGASDQRAELAALGALLYELVTGRTLVVARRAQADVPPKLAPLLQRLLGTDPRQRKPSCAELLVLLDRQQPPQPWMSEWGGPVLEPELARQPGALHGVPAVAAFAGMLAGALVGLGMLDHALMTSAMQDDPLAIQDEILQDEGIYYDEYEYIQDEFIQDELPNLPLPPR